MRNRGLTIVLTIVASAIMFATMPQFVRAQVTYIEFAKLEPTQASYDINGLEPASNLLKQYSIGITSSVKADVRLATVRLQEMFAQHSYNTVRLAKFISRKSYDYFAESLNSKHKLTMKLVRIQERFASKQVNKTANALAIAGINAHKNSREVFEQINVNAYAFVDGSVKGIQKSPTVMVRVANNSANYALDRLTLLVDSQTQKISQTVNAIRVLNNETLYASSGATLVRANLSDHPVVADIVPKFEINSPQLAIADLFKSEVSQTFDFTDYHSLNQIPQSTPLKTYIKENLLATPGSLLAIYEAAIYTRPSIPQVDPTEIYAALPEMYLGSSAQGLMESKIHESPKFAFTFPGENINSTKFNERIDSGLAISTNILKKFVLNDFSEVYYRLANAFNTSEQTQRLVDLKLERVGQLADLLIAPTKRTLNLAINTSVPLQFSSNGSFLFDEVSKPQQVVQRDVTPRVLGESTTSWWQTLLSKFTGSSQTTTVIYPTINEPITPPVQTVQPAPVSTNTSPTNLSLTIANTIRNILNNGEYTLLQGPKGDTGPEGPQGPRGIGAKYSVTNITLPDQYDALTITALNSATATLSGNFTLSSLSTAGLLKNDASGVVSSLAYGDNGECLTITLGVPDWGVCGGGGGADADATYIVQTATDAPTNAQVLASLATGLLKNTTTTGVLSVATAGTDYVVPSVASLSSLATVGALNSGSITSGFGSIDIGPDTITSGAINGQTISSSANFTGSIAVTGAITGATSYNGLIVTANTGTITTGTWQGTAVADTYVANDLTISGGTMNNSVIGGVTPSTGAFTTGSFSGTLAANGGITFDAATDTLGAFTASGTIDLATNILTNIGNTGTDFVAGTGALTLAGDLTITGDDLFMTTNTSGFLLVADGTNFNPVAMSGDITIDSTGATFIGADKVTEADLKAVDAAGDEECLTYETTTGDFEWQTCGGLAIGSAITSGSTNTVLYSDSSGNLAQTDTGGVGTLCLVSTNGGVPSFGACSGSAATAWSSLTAPSGNLSIAHGANTTTMTSNSVTTGTAWTHSSSSLTSGKLVDLQVTGTTTGLTNQTVLNVSSAGSNNGASRTTYGAQISNTHTGTTSTNVGLSVSASGGTNNYAALFTAGNVGIGTTTPTQLLHLSSTVDGNILVTADSDNSDETDAAQIQLSQDGGISTALWGMDGNTANDMVFAVNSTTSPSIRFETASTGTSFGGTPRMTILNGGNVGIGDDTPSALFTVGSGDVFKVNSSGNLTVSSGSSNTISIFTTDLTGDTPSLQVGQSNSSMGELFYDSTNDYMGIKTYSAGVANSISMYFPINSNNVGIGDASPAALFTVGSGDLFQVSSAGNMSVVSTAPIGQIVTTGLTGQTATFQVGQSNGSAGELIYNTDSDYLQIRNKTFDGFINSGIYINSPGGSNNTFVGIGTGGTVTPSEYLEVYDGNIRISNNTNPATLVLWGDRANTDDTGQIDSRIKFRHDGLDTAGINIDALNYVDYSQLKFDQVTTGGGAVNIMTLGRSSTAANYVGIGTTDPTTILDIGSSDLGSGAAGPIITVGRNTNATNTGAGSINLQQKDGTAGYVWQDDAGNVRIHTAAPTHANDTAGTVIGTQSSTRETKQDITSYTNYASALQAVVSAPLHTFRYIKEVEGYGENSPLAKARLGFIADEVSGMFMWGNTIDQVSVNGLLMGSVKALDNKISQIAVQLGNKNSGLFIEPLRYASVDSVGQAKILAGSKTVRVNFSTVYQYQPIVTISARGEEVLSNNFKYTIINEDESGFTIKISSSQNEDLEFAWHAFASEGARLSVSDGSTQNIVLVKSNQSEGVAAEGGQVAGDFTSEPEIIEEVLPSDGFFIGEPDAQTEPVTEPIEESASEPTVESPQEES